MPYCLYQRCYGILTASRQDRVGVGNRIVTWGGAGFRGGVGIGLRLGVEQGRVGVGIRLEPGLEQDLEVGE